MDENKNKKNNKKLNSKRSFQCAVNKSCLVYRILIKIGTYNHLTKTYRMIVGIFEKMKSGGKI